MVLNVNVVGLEQCSVPNEENSHLECKKDPILGDFLQRCINGWDMCFSHKTFLFPLETCIAMWVCKLVRLQ